MLMRLLVASAIVLGLAFSVAPGGAESVFQGADPCTAKYVPGSDRWNQCKGIKTKKRPSQGALCYARCRDNPRYLRCMNVCRSRR
jgi:hypothetical protein